MTETLLDLYILVRKKTGWLRNFIEAGFNPDEIEYLEKIDNDFMGYDPELEVKKWEASLDREGGYEVAFADNDEERVNILSQRINHIYATYEKSKAKDEPYADRYVALTLSNIGLLERLRKKYRGNILHKIPRTETAGWICDEDIERARRVPLENLLDPGEMTKHGYLCCRWHDDNKPSMLVKNGFGYCFSCGEWVDSIKWCMEVKNMGFIEAVRHLVG